MQDINSTKEFRDVIARLDGGSAANAYFIKYHGISYQGITIVYFTIVESMFCTHDALLVLWFQFKKFCVSCLYTVNELTGICDKDAAFT